MMDDALLGGCCIEVGSLVDEGCYYDEIISTFLLRLVKFLSGISQKKSSYICTHTPSPCIYSYSKRDPRWVTSFVTTRLIQYE